MDKGSLVRKVYAVIVMIVLIAADQITKAAVVAGIDFREQKAVIDGFFSINYVRNTGSAFSFLADKSWGIYVLSAFSLIMAVIIFILTLKAVTCRLNLIAVSGILLTVGAVGNLIDRIRLRYVIDFLRFDFGSYTFPIFNVADICAVCGTFLFVFIIIFRGKDTDTLIDSLKVRKGTIDNDTDS